VAAAAGRLPPPAVLPGLDATAADNANDDDEDQRGSGGGFDAPLSRFGGNRKRRTSTTSTTSSTTRIDDGSGGTTTAPPPTGRPTTVVRPKPAGRRGARSPASAFPSSIRVDEDDASNAARCHDDGPPSSGIDRGGSEFAAAAC
jgi:hypothetical protein